MDIIDRDNDPAEVEEGQLEKEFGELNRLAESEGFQRYIATMQADFDKISDSLFSDEMVVIDTATEYAREEAIAQGKILRRYIKLVDERRAELKDQLEQNQRDKTSN